MDLIKMAREMGKELQATEEYKRLAAAKDANDEDVELQNGIEEFNLVRMKVQTEMQMQERDPEKIDKLNAELREIYNRVMTNPHMMEFNIAKSEMDDIMNQISGILMLCLNGEDPETCEVPSGGCSGSCDSCAGCH